MRTRLAAKPEDQVRSFIAKFEPRHQALIRATRKALRRRFPVAYGLAYDNYNLFVLGYSPTERPSDCVVSMAAVARSKTPFRDRDRGALIIRSVSVKQRPRRKAHSA